VKFLCEQCKAKYQIADDKIVGRTVRMKCRKCGHLIEVRAAVTETSAAGAMPPPSQAALPPTGPSSGGRTGFRAPPPRATPLGASLTAPRAAAPKPERLPSALAGAFKSTVQREEEVSAPFDMSELSPGSSDWYVAVNGVPVGPVRIAEIRRKAAMGAVTEDSLVWQEGLDEWRALRTFPDLVEIVREAGAGGGTGRPSGLPVPSSTPPPKPVSVWPSPPVAPIAPQPPRAPAPVHAPAPRMAPAPLAAALAAGTVPAVGPGALSGSGRSNVVAINSRLATAERIEEAAPLPPAALAAPVTDSHAVATPMGNPFVPPPDLAPAAMANAFVSAPSAFAADPFGMGAAPSTFAAGAPAPSAVGPNALAAPPSVAPAEYQSQKAGPPTWILLILLVIAAAFGITLAIAFALPRAQPPQAVVVQVPVATAPPSPQPQAASSTLPAAPDTPTNNGPVAPSRPSARTAGNGLTAASPTAGANNGSTASNAAGASNGGNGRTLDLHGIGGGPTITPTDDPGSDGPKAPGSCLSEGQIRQVIQLHQVGIQRTCWERSSSGKSAVNVSVSLTIGPDGTAQGPAATGDDPAVAKCIENDVRGWHFPAMGCSQKIAVPFKFVRQ
jgi:predicted Zn finger-like uncharacterized protein